MDEPRDCHMWNLKMGVTNEFIYKTEIESQM